MTPPRRGSIVTDEAPEDMETDSIFAADAFEQMSEEASPDSSFVGEEEEAPQRPTELRPVVNRGRVPATEVLTMAWMGTGMLLAQTGIDPPVGRVMSLQAPLAGNHLDKILAGTFIDKLIQPLLQKKDAAEGLAALFAAPLLVGLLERNEQLAPVALPILQSVLMSSLSEMVPLIKKQKRDQDKNIKAMADLADEFNIPEGTDPFEALMQQIFGPPAPESGE